MQLERPSLATDAVHSTPPKQISKPKSVIQLKQPGSTAMISQFRRYYLIPELNPRQCLEVFTECHMINPSYRVFANYLCFMHTGWENGLKTRKVC